MPNKLTDAEIKQALECCSAGVCKAECFGYFIVGTNDCTTQLAKYALDLINRQDAEIEELKCKNTNLTSLQKDLTSSKAEVERLLKKTQRPQDADPMDFCGVLCDFAEGIIAKTKAEAYKEAFEKVKSYIDVGHLRKPTELCFSALDVVNMLDNLLNELVGDGK